MDTELLAVGKRIGLSLMEINELRVADLFDIAKAYTGNQDEEAKEADQADIDAFYR
ncbi:hypothetical protein SAMN02799630_01223 [Paenibacillus sp. UNCCL117]|uniref:hypothetical protein n=1 Tax=unclassified Paenibacillus TaxID=185978 RepID=UPI0008904E90|nr:MULTISPECIES: hypothetical protein [unclassified Paenibacillus]SDC70047.1 hypothetical protein SAMN04488602_103201 [Paenibacillus sp. cl123]SFW24097.1 hypothetical protein SAMN02799630_01223 [Paenibacillus sp. UNCCL117]